VVGEVAGAAVPVVGARGPGRADDGVHRDAAAVDSAVVAGVAPVAGELAAAARAGDVPLGIALRKSNQQGAPE
jgi:hypothetical protein